MKLKNVFLSVVFLSILLFGCSNAPRSSESADTSGASSQNIIESVSFDDPVVIDDILIWEHQYIETEWDQIEEGWRVDISELDFWGDTNAISSNQDAVAVGKAIITELHNRGKFSEHQFVSLHHSLDDDVWYLMLGRPNTYGDYIWVGINGSDGCLLGAYTTH